MARDACVRVTGVRRPIVRQLEGRLGQSWSPLDGARRREQRAVGEARRREGDAHRQPQFGPETPAY
jgi:hypothetical protein